jgi:Protein of unknown function (DUF1579)
MSQAKQAQGKQTDAIAAQVAAMKVEPQKEHQWLQKLVGDWTYEAEETAKAGQPEAKVTGTEHVRSMGDIWVVAEGEGEMPGGGAATTMMTLGYDPGKKRFVGTWIGSMMTHQWLYDGELDPSQRVLTLESEGPSMSGDGTMSKYRDAIEFKSDDHRVLTASVLGEDGKWQTFMAMAYRRTKPRA